MISEPKNHTNAARAAAFQVQYSRAFVHFERLTLKIQLETFPHIYTSRLLSLHQRQPEPSFITYAHILAPPDSMASISAAEYGSF
jgi:hypothetical protein